jgi:hypothetical protein
MLQTAINPERRRQKNHRDTLHCVFTNSLPLPKKLAMDICLGMGFGMALVLGLGAIVSAAQQPST